MDDILEVRDWSDGMRGVFYHSIEQQIELRLDGDLLNLFKKNHSQDEGHQTIINRALREYIARQQS